MEEGVLSATGDVFTEKKIELYLNVIELFMDAMDPKFQRELDQNPKKRANFGRHVSDIGARISLIGSEDVVKKYFEFRMLSQGGAASEKILDCFGGIILAMRADLVGIDGVSADMVLGTFLVLSDKLKANK